ncbi:hypothetical protein BKA69DRAFT_539838 [Paraphysoderma sedebokerense]|nr:hypothetical protein BKA69DRAFT_539838 [Paraphysoderma sedebokerense]
MSDIPYALEAEVTISQQELEVLRAQYNSELPTPSEQSIFNFAWGLVRSKRRPDIELGVKLLRELQKSSQSLKRECLYYLALGYYRLGDFVEARNYTQTLLEKEPRNMQAQSLLKVIDSKVQRDGVIGLAIVGGVAAVGGVLLASLLRRK